MQLIEVGVDLYKGSDGSILALNNFCNGGSSHHGDFALGDAKF